MKKCSRCHKNKDLSEFYLDKSRGDGYSTKCKKCDRECRRLRHEKLKARRKNQIQKILSKICKKCGEKKSVSEFYPELRNSDGYSSWCKSCHQNHSKSYYRKLTKRKPKSILKIKNKRCPKCKKTKDISEFYKAYGKPDGYSTICKDCNSNSRKTYRYKIAERSFEEIEIAGKKRCWICKRKLPISEFNFSRQSKDGFSSCCRKCGKEYKIKHYKNHQYEYYSRLITYKDEYKERYRAYRIVSNAIRKGDLIRPDICSKCGKEGIIVAHHEDYLSPLDVIWLCLSCDRQLHAIQRQEMKSKKKIASMRSK